MGRKANRYYLKDKQLCLASLDNVRRLAKWTGMPNWEQASYSQLRDWLKYEASVLYNQWGGLY